MKHALKLMVTLLIVFSVTAANASDSIRRVTHCKMVNDQSDKYTVIFHSPETSKVRLRIYDADYHVLHQEVFEDNAFAKTFDLSTLKVGKYQIEVKSDGYIFSEEIDLSDTPEEFQLMLNPLQDNKVVLLGSYPDASLSMYILDATGEVVFSERFKESKQLHKKYNLQRLGGDQATFVFYGEGDVIKEQVVVLD